MHAPRIGASPLHVTKLRPIARDPLPTHGWPVLASRQAPLDRAAVSGAPVTHSYASLGFYTGGRSRLQQRGDWTVREGDVMLVPAGEPHRMLELQRAELWGLAFCVPCFAADGGSDLLEPFERVRDGSAAVVHIPAARHEFLASLFRELRERSSPHFNAVQRSLVTLILNEVVSASSPLSPSLDTPRSVVSESLRFIERNCLRRLTLADVAAAVGRSPAYVTTALKQATGRSAVAWIVSGRMAEARRLLLHSDEMIDVIAERVGYADATHFIRMFRREHGATPAAWRAAHAK
jgi:AraC-like DNA-binding protein